MKSIILHLRFPFSLFLLPVYLFSLSQNSGWRVSEAILLGLIWHLLVYPASNALNSYYDQDEGPIGGLENPPQATKELYWVALIFDVIAIAWSSLQWGFGVGLGILGYIAISRAYSSYPIRLKQYPFLSWAIVGFFQGAYVFSLSGYALTDQLGDWLPALLSSGTLWAIYPMTQVYQHEEDAKRGDRTLSLVLGVRGTFIFTACLFGLTSTGYIYLLQAEERWIWLSSQVPIVGFFLFWMYRVFHHEKWANFTFTMYFNGFSALLLNLVYLFFILKK